MGLKATQAEVDRLVAAGLIDPAELAKPTMADWLAAQQSAKHPAGTKPKRRTKPLLVPECFVPPATWLIPVEVYSITNSRDIKAAIGRKGHQRRKVMHAMGKHHAALVFFADQGVHRNIPIRVTMTKLGGRPMDDDNLPAALKHIRDAIADLLAIDDGSPLLKWVPQAAADERVGVKVELELLEQE
jgi:hypothetical protein